MAASCVAAAAAEVQSGVELRREHSQAVILCTCIRE